MAEGKQGTQLPFGSFAALAVFLAGVLVSPYSGLLPTRPTPQHVKQDHYPQAQDIPARLWEDPFAATAPDPKADATKSGKLYQTPKDRREGLQRLIQSNPACTRLMPVLVKGGPYGEHAEHRRRTRYAVVSALQRWSFSAHDDEHIGYIELALLPDVSTSVQPLRIPFEGYRRIPGRRTAGVDCPAGENAFVLWLDEDAFREKPIAKLSSIIGTLTAGRPGYPEVSLIGPVTSYALQTMLEEVAGDEKGKRTWTHTFRLTIMSWGATRPDAEFKDANKNTLSFNPYNTNIVLHRPVVDDGKIIDRLVAELILRGLKRDKNDRIAIVSESDTDYGTRLASIVETKVSGKRDKKGTAQPVERSKDDSADRCGALLASPVLEFHYLRGLDGETALAAVAAKTEERDVRKDAKKAPTERPSAAGLSQLDYAERAAAAIRVRHDALRACNSRIAAIGVLGTDFYDKALLIQAVKKEMPTALFFTTDLDARMVDANQIEWTRNLIVGSGFGLELNHDLQESVAPFRDNYQTAAYLATLLALDRLTPPPASDPKAAPARPGEATMDAWLKRALVARTYEIGRREIFDFGPAGAADSQNGACSVSAVQQCASAGPEPSEHWQLSSGTKWMAIGAVLGGFLLLLSTSWAIRRAVWNLLRRRSTLLPLLLLALIVVTALWMVVTQDGAKGEPFRWAQGISAWPTLALRFIALTLALYYLFNLWQQGSQSLEPLIHKYYSRETAISTGSLPRTIFGWHDRIMKCSKPTSSLLVRQYCALSTNRRRAFRIGAVTAVYLLFCVCLVFLYDLPNAPVRGFVTADIHWVLLFVFIPVNSFLLFSVVDTVRLFTAFIDGLAIAKSDYPSSTFKYFADRLNVPQSVFERYGRDWIDIQFIAERAEVVNRLVYFPFVVLALAVIARSTIFDNWHTPPSLMIIFLMGAAYSAYCALGVRKSAESARRVAVENMTRRLAAEKAAPAPETPDVSVNGTELARWLINDVTNTRKGAFAPLPEQPFWKALLIPLTGFGGAELLQYVLLVA